MRDEESMTIVVYAVAPMLKVVAVGFPGVVASPRNTVAPLAVPACRNRRASAVDRQAVVPVGLGVLIINFCHSERPCSSASGQHRNGVLAQSHRSRVIGGLSIIASSSATSAADLVGCADGDDHHRRRCCRAMSERGGAGRGRCRRPREAENPVEAVAVQLTTALYAGNPSKGRYARRRR